MFKRGSSVRGRFFGLPYTGTVSRVSDTDGWLAYYVDFDEPLDDGGQAYTGGVIFADRNGNAQHPSLSTIEQE